MHACRGTDDREASLDRCGGLSDLTLWFDDTIVVVDKPAGVLTIRGGFGDSPYLQQILQPRFGRLWTVHRLDLETSGVLVFARTAAAHRTLNTQFQERQVSKTYHALVRGCPQWVDQTVDLPLRRDGDRRHRTVIDPHRGKPSVTHLHVLERFAGHALLEAVPETGRTHQVRAHLAALGLPILGDRLYVREKPVAPEDPTIQRTALHARRLKLAHPTTGEVLCFEAPYPADWTVALQWLRRHT
jgi:tRNA pseudouridine32 synthase/23S rRNA pseudouridine746 synthase